MPKYIKKPVVVVNAVLFNGKNTKEVLRFIYPDRTLMGLRSDEIIKLPITIKTTAGSETIRKHDYIVKDEFCRFSTMKPKVFAASYVEIILPL